ncbi:hypothetical protein KI387_028368 [Taxus chinensis]|uniref:Uncharacterized protein n=1 Tax=Taxus chinensis TaxID=29808 RepID=A0AA38G1B0_TAXCH|nr:hypothetical protein KI387_028368 [Taxus chinensis]
MVGMRPLERSLEKLDEVRKKKLSEMIGTSGSGQVAVAPSTGPSRAVGSGSAPSTSEVGENGFGKKSAASMLSGKRPLQPIQNIKKAMPGRQGAGKKTDGNGQNKTAAEAETHEDIEPGDMSLEEIEGRVGSLFQADVLPNLKSAVWKERLEGWVSPCRLVPLLGESTVKKGSDLLSSRLSKRRLKGLFPKSKSLLQIESKAPLIVVSEEVCECWMLFEQAVESPFDLVVDGASEDEVLFRFNLLEGAKLTNLLEMVNLMITLNAEPMRANLKLAQGHAKGMHPMLGNILGPRNKTIIDLKKMHNIEGYLRT